MAKKSSVYFAGPLLAITENRPESESASGRLNAVAERYLEICKRHSITLTDEEKNILGNCLSGSLVEPLLIRHLADEVDDSEFADTQEAKALVKKLKKYTFSELVAVVELLGF